MHCSNLVDLFEVLLEFQVLNKPLQNFIFLVQEYFASLESVFDI